MRNFVTSITLLLILITIVACGSRTAIRPGDTVDVAFEKAMGLYERERYAQSAQAFETVLSIARGTDLAAEAQFYLAKSHYHNRSYLIAASEFRRFARNYTRDERRIEAEFLEAHSHYRMSPRFNLDQTETYNAIDRFQLFVTRYPGSDFAEQAIGYLDELRDKLAKKQFHAAEMYMRIRQYQSAALYYGLTVDHYPESIWAEQALVNKILAYVNFAERSIEARQVERFSKAVESYEQYVEIFPRGVNRLKADEYYDRALTGIAKASSPTAGR